MKGLTKEGRKKKKQRKEATKEGRTGKKGKAPSSTSSSAVLHTTTGEFQKSPTENSPKVGGGKMRTEVEKEGWGRKLNKES